MGSPPGSEGKRSGQREVTCVGGDPKRNRAAAYWHGNQVRGLVEFGFETKSNRFRGAPTPAVSTRLFERRRHREPPTDGETAELSLRVHPGIERPPSHNIEVAGSGRLAAAFDPTGFIAWGAEERIS